MGLLYVFPVETSEADFVDLRADSITLKTYGLPYIFWIYALCVLAVVFFMFLAIKNPVLKLISLGDETDALLGYALLTFLGSLPVFTLAFFFYEKRIIKTRTELTLEYRVYGIRVFKESFKLSQGKDPLEVQAFLDSPNVARLKGSEDNRGFQNKGYFILWLTLETGKRILVDRHSRKVDLDKLKKLLELRS